ncbi:MAG: hypothetical protein Q9218_005559 [Villophora microphyllina]
MSPNTSTQQACAAGSKTLEDHLRGMLLNSHGVPPQDEYQPPALNVDRQLHKANDTPSHVSQHTSAQDKHFSSRDHPARAKRAPSRTHQASNHGAVTAGAPGPESPLPYSLRPARKTRQRSTPKASIQSQGLAGQASPAASPVPNSVKGVRNRVPQPPLQSEAGIMPRQAGTPTQPQPPHNAAQYYHLPSVAQTHQYPIHYNNTHLLPSSYGRSHPQNQQLFNPHAHTSHMQNPFGRQGPNFNRNDAFFNNTPAQIRYLNALAEQEVPKAAISVQEEQEKERMREILEDICQKAITEYETMKDPLFDGSTVSLKCFGSLRSGFATRASDMDLAVGSPLSEPDTASAESEIPRILEKALLNHGYGARLLTRTRVPIIRFCEKPTPELAALLQEERLKWEGGGRTRSNKAKASKTSKDIKHISNQQPRSNKQAQTSNTKDPAERLDEPETESVNDRSETGSSNDNPVVKPDSDTADGGAGSNPSVSSEGGVSLTLQQLLGYGGCSESVLHHSHQPPDDVTTSRAPEGTGDAQAGPLAKERRELVLPDEEIVRLYRLATKEGWFEPQERSTIFAFIKAVEAGCAEDQLADLRTALFSLPDILNRYRPPPEHHLDFPKDGVGVQCDINFSNRLALHNSTMLRCYNLCDPRVKPMVLFVKAWAKRRNINSPYHGTLSSYGYVLMVLHYLVNVTNPPICPNLQTIYMAARDDSPENNQIIDGHSVRFWRNEKAIQQWAKTGMMTEDRHSTVGSLLRGFFLYYAVPNNGFSWSTDVLSLRTPGGILTKHQKGWIGAKTTVLDPVQEGRKGQEIRHRYLFAIEDPFETEHNIARTVVHNGIVAIRDEFRRAQRLIHAAENGNVEEDLFEEAAAKDDLNYRYFGPRPRAKDSRSAAKLGIDGLNAKKESSDKKATSAGPASAPKNASKADHPKKADAGADEEPFNEQITSISKARA